MKKIVKRLKDLWQITKKSVIAWNKADPFRQSATIAYYAIFSIPALLVIVISLAGFAFGQEAVQGKVSAQIGSALGEGAAEQIEEIIARAGAKKSSVWATLISIGTLILGATGVFTQLQVSLNTIWEVKVVAKKKWLKTIRDRLFSFGMVISIAFMLLISLAISAGLNVLSEWLQSKMPDVMLYIFEILNIVVSLGVITVLFAIMFKILPDAKVLWRDVWIGALVTSALFTLGKFALGIYFGKAEPGSTYGAAGTVVLMMLWVSYSCMILFFGAEFTKQYTTHFGRKIVPKRDAILIEVPEEERLIAEKKAAVKEQHEKDRKTGKG